MGEGWAKGKIKIFGKEDAEKTQSYPGLSTDFARFGVGWVARLVPFAPGGNSSLLRFVSKETRNRVGGAGRRGQGEGTWGRAPPALDPAM